MRLILVVAGLMLSLFSQGQTLKALEKAGDEAVKQKNYYVAMTHFSEALGIDPAHIGLNFKYAEVARHFKAYERAAIHYGTVAASAEANNYPQAIFWQGMMQKSLGRYEEAEAQFLRFLTMKSILPSDSYLADRAKKELEWCRKAQKGSVDPDPLIRVEPLGKQVNSEYSEFAPLYLGDTLYYSSYRFEKKDDKRKPQRKVAKLMFWREGTRARALGLGMNDESKSTAHMTLSADGKRLYFTRCDYVSEAELRCQIYYKTLDRPGRWSKKSTSLPTFINQDGYTATQPAIGYDSIAGKELLFFASDRPGGQGKMDIWFSVVEGNTFSKPENLQDINTPENEISPFFHSPSQILYFSTDGRTGYGQLDVWNSSLDSSRWLAPELLPAPINSGYDDLYYVPGNVSNPAWLASNRPGSLYLDPDNQACCNDLFRVSFLPKPPPSDTAVLVVETPPPSTPKTPPQEPQTLEDFLPLALYFDNDEPDKRTRRITTRKTYAETFERYYQRKNEYIKQYPAPLEKEEKEEAETAMDAFFEEEIQKGHTYLIRFSEILLKRLENGDQVEIFIKGFTSPRAQSDYNLSLGQRRISSVRNHFQDYKEGVFRPYLTKGQLRITERSFGETLASKEVSDELEDLRNSVYSIGAARERRVEIVEIQTNRNN